MEELSIRQTLQPTNNKSLLNQPSSLMSAIYAYSSRLIAMPEK